VRKKVKETGGERTAQVGETKRNQIERIKGNTSLALSSFAFFFFVGIPSIHFVLFLLLLLFLFNWLVSQSRQQNVHKIGCVVEKKAKKIGGGGV